MIHVLVAQARNIRCAVADDMHVINMNVIKEVGDISD